MVKAQSAKDLEGLRHVEWGCIRGSKGLYKRQEV